MQVTVAPSQAWRPRHQGRSCKERFTSIQRGTLAIIQHRKQSEGFVPGCSTVACCRASQALSCSNRRTASSAVLAVISVMPSWTFQGWRHLGPAADGLALASCHLPLASNTCSADLGLATICVQSLVAHAPVALTNSLRSLMDQRNSCCPLLHSSYACCSATVWQLSAGAAMDAVACRDLSLNATASVCPLSCRPGACDTWRSNSSLVACGAVSALTATSLLLGNMLASSSASPVSLARSWTSPA